MEGSASLPDTTFQNVQCCCGETNCPHLAHANSLIEGLERNVQTAATYGQALLERHEESMASAARERHQMTATIENLEKEKLELEQRNAQTVQDNRNLLDQLEQLNNALADSDTQVNTLTATLEATQEELERVTILARRTETLERQLLQLEKDQAQLHDTLSTTVQEERTALQRWRMAEKTIGDLQDQMDRMEKEATEERERHVELVGRMERRRAVEAELRTAAGRLKGSAAAKNGAHEKSGTNVVSHFVNDILNQNTQLQMGIVELREMLYSSNEEVERLRDQLQAHQPISPLQEKVNTPTLQKEMSPEPGYNREIHVHHHYHAPAERKETPKSKTPLHRVKKKRHVVTAGHFTPPRNSHSPRASISGFTVSGQPSRPAKLSRNAVSTPNHHQRWSIQSNNTVASTTVSSVPGSPYSNSHRTSSIFDRVFSDSSRPTSPEDNDPGSPELFAFPNPQARLHSVDSRSTSMPVKIQPKSSPATATITQLSPPNSQSQMRSGIDDFELSPSAYPTILEENEDGPDKDSLTSPTFSSELDTETDEIYFPKRTRPGLHRAASHESLISISGMDIHTLKSRPSQLLLPHSPRFASPSSSVASSQPVLSAMTATATRASRRDLDSSTYNRSLLYGAVGNRKPGLRPQPSKGTLGQKVGGWVFGKWGTGVSPDSSLTAPSDTDRGRTGSSGSETIHNQSASPSPRTSEFPKQPIPIKRRPPGVNQKGPLTGFFGPVPDTPIQVTVTHLDEDALKESLAE